MRARSQETPSPLLAGNDPASVCASDLSPFSSVFCACVLFGARFAPDRRRRLTPPRTEQSFGLPSETCSIVGSMFEAEGGLSSALNHSTSPSIIFALLQEVLKAACASVESVLARNCCGP